MCDTLVGLLLTHYKKWEDTKRRHSEKDMEYNDKYKKNEGIRNYLQNTTQKIKE
jgi:hypothetical protein